jgi:hypothetical protein
MHDIAQKQTFFFKLPELDLDPDLVVNFPDPDPDPDPAKRSGSDRIRIRIRIRIRNTACMYVCSQESCSCQWREYLLICLSIHCGSLQAFHFWLDKERGNGIA